MRTERPASSGAIQAVSGRAVAVDFDGGSMASDAGALLLGQADAAVRLVDRLAACFEDRRDGRFVEHSVRTLVGRCAFGIALGDEDSINHDVLRGDPVMAVLAEKSTPSRLELGGLSPSGGSKIVHDGSAIADLSVTLFLDAHPARPVRRWCLGARHARQPTPPAVRLNGPMCCFVPCAAPASPTPASPSPHAEVCASNRSRSPHGFASASVASRSPWTRTILSKANSAPREDEYPPPQPEAAHNSPFPATNGDIAKPNRPSPADGRSNAPRNRHWCRKSENYRRYRAAPLEPEAYEKSGLTRSFETKLVSCV